MGFFDELGLTDRAARRQALADAGAVNTTQPVGVATPLPGQTPEGLAGIVNDPNLARMSSGGTGGAPPFSPDAFFDFMEQYPPTNEGMRQGYEAAKQIWGNQVPELLEHPQRLDKFKFADGSTYDVIGGAGGPNPQWVRNLEGPGHGSTLGQLGGAVGGNWQASISPGFGFRVGEMSKALQQRAAAKGTIATGGFAKELAQYVNNLAGDEYEAAFGRNLSLADLGLRATGQAAGLGSNYGQTLGQTTTNQVQANTDLITGAANARAGVTAGNAAGMGNTIGELGTILAPSAAGWLKKIRGKGGDTLARSPYLDLREGTV